MKDLFESFGKLQIPAFIYMNTNDISVDGAHSILNAVKIFKVLEAVAGVVGSKVKLDVDLDSRKRGGYIGLNFIPTAQKDDWIKAVQPKEKVVGWFGYSQNSETGEQTLDVWFYCGADNSAKASEVRSKLGNRFPQPPLPPAVTESAEEKNYVWVSLPVGQSGDNQAWFISVFDAVVPRP